MPHNWLRLFNRLIQPNVSLSERELAVWGTASSQGVPAPALAGCGKTGKFEVLPFRCGVFCG
jgi:hypothetical protein